MKICIVTGSRAEFFILKNLIKKLNKSKFFKDHVVITGSHLSKDFGNNLNQISSSKINVVRKLNLKINNDNESDISQYFSLGVKLFSNTLNKIKPDLLMILGDRYEIYAAAVAACFNRVPIAHIHGGERTEGVIDEALRHSITKLSHIHFVSTKEYYNRVRQLGENKNYIRNIGSLGVESLNNFKFLSRNQIEKKLKLKFRKKNILITYHSETLKSRSQNKKNIITILNSLKKMKNTTLIFTMPGADSNFKAIISEIKKFSKKNKNSFLFKSLGDELYFSICNQVDFMMGNSSSGIIEMPSYKKGTINIGNRQNGRVKAKSVIDIDCNEKKIKSKINFLYSKKFNQNLKKIKNPYDGGKSSDKIIKFLKKVNLEDILNKKFIDY